MIDVGEIFFILKFQMSLKIDGVKLKCVFTMCYSTSGIDCAFYLSYQYLANSWNFSLQLVIAPMRQYKCLYFF